MYRTLNIADYLLQQEVYTTQEESKVTPFSIKKDKMISFIYGLINHYEKKWDNVSFKEKGLHEMYEIIKMEM